MASDESGLPPIEGPEGSGEAAVEKGPCGGQWDRRTLFKGAALGTARVIIVSESTGVSSGLGWYIDWARNYSDYNKVFAALIIMAAFFSTIMTVLFKVRDWVLVWQKGVIKW